MTVSPKGPHRAKPVLITGGAGFIGSNLADRIAAEGYPVILLDSMTRRGVERNCSWLMARHRIQVVRGDIRDETLVGRMVRDAQVIFHFAAQVAVTSSLEDPMQDFETNIRGTLNLLEASRKSGQIPVIFASTNKVYGDLGDVSIERFESGYRPANAYFRAGIGEDRPLDFHTPYGCSKGSADQYVLDYARSFGIPSAVLRMSCIYGPRQMGTEDQGWVAHFLIRALNGAPITIFGDGHQVRDILYVDDAVEAYIRAWTHIRDIQGQAFNLGGGPSNAVSLHQVLDRIETLIDRKIDLRFAQWRQGDQRWYVSDTRRIEQSLGFRPRVEWREGLRRLSDWLRSETNLRARTEEVVP